ncbi:hypothetical protein SKAU_G00095190 [Synaphobranchus kaupii]|uniref:Uncharacterized protein n=1 Tax=Synaphobranchus kaupii TaxID=118154 RepID=A0A9Q1FXH9_SYNKA|nr:hypothetical protein SKAU_G00095190 [Synaphobranchus kaupii]
MESSGEVDTEMELINIKAELRTMEWEIHKLVERQMRLNTRMAMLEAAGASDATRMAGAEIQSSPNAEDEDEPQGRSNAGALATSTPKNSHLCLPTPLRPPRLRPGAEFFTHAPTDGVWIRQSHRCSKGRPRSPPPPAPDFTTKNRFEDTTIFCQHLTFVVEKFNLKEQMPMLGWI